MSDTAVPELLSEDEWEVPIAEDDLDENVADAALHQQKVLEAHLQQDKAEMELAGEEVLIDFILPDGRVEQSKFFMGQTVEVLKMYLEKVFGLSYETTSLYLEEEFLCDPLSLIDLPFVAKATNKVIVKQQ